MKSIYTLMQELDSIPGVAGDEDLVAAYIKEKLVPLVDESFADSLGNQYFVKKGTHPDLKLMLAAHMDEIGYMVNFIDDKGFVHFVPVGFQDSRMVVNQVLTIHTDKGAVKGVTAAGKMSIFVSTDDAKKAIPFSDLHLDIGTKSKQETLELGVQVGDYMTYARTGEFLNGGPVYSGKSVDDRSGCAVLIEVMKRIAEKNITPTVYGVATVQEEVGVRGAGPASFSIQPDVALAIDVTLGGGSPGVEEKQYPINLGAGPAIKFFDLVPGIFYGNNVPKRLTRRLVEVAEKDGIPYQREVLINGGTDGWAISLAGKGVLTGCISLPSRYIHSATGCVDMTDLENAVELIVGFIEDLQEKL